MYASLGSGPVATLPSSVPLSTLRSWSSGGGKDCVPQGTKRPGVRASGRTASVWQVSEAANSGVSSPANLGFTPPLLQTLLALGPTPRLSCLHVPPPPRPRAPFQASCWPLALLDLDSRAAAEGRDACGSPHLSWLLMKLHPCERSLLRVRWVCSPPLLFQSPHLPGVDPLFPLKVFNWEDHPYRVTKKRLVIQRPVNLVHLDEGSKTPGDRDGLGEF